MASGEAGLRSAPLSISPWWLTMKCCNMFLISTGNPSTRATCRCRISRPKATHKLPARRVTQAPRGTKLLNLADVVEDGSSN